MGQCVCGKPPQIWNEVRDRRKISASVREKGCREEVRANGYLRNPFLAQPGLGFGSGGVENLDVSGRRRLSSREWGRMDI